MAIVMRGEMADGDLRSLAFNKVVTWNAPGSLTLYVPDSGTNAVCCIVVARNVVGPQPTSFVVTVSPTGSNVTQSISTVGLTSNFANTLAIISAAPVILNSQTLIVNPIGSASGSMTFDVLGYSFSSTL